MADSFIRHVGKHIDIVINYSYASLIKFVHLIENVGKKERGE